MMSQKKSVINEDTKASLMEGISRQKELYVIDNFKISSSLNKEKKQENKHSFSCNFFGVGASLDGGL